MKRPETMIREYEKEHAPMKKAARLYTYIRPLKNGEFTFEIHAAVNAKRKGEELMTKCVFKMRTDKSRFDQRDILWYSSWSMAAPPDHWVVDFHESGRGEMYMERANRADEFNVWHSDYAARGSWHDCRFPLGTMLNGFEGTKYRYCGYTPSSGLSIPEYLELYDISPKVELISKAGLYQLLNEESICVIAEDAEFVKWLAKNRETVRSKWWNIRQCIHHYGKTVNESRLNELKAKRAASKRALEVKMATERVRNRIRETKKYAKAIRALYEKLKWICGTYKSYDVCVPQNNEEMVREGEAMHNCIGHNYPPRVADGSTICVFLRRDGKPYIDIAVNARTFKVSEVRRVCNESVSASERMVAEQIAARIGKALKAA